MSKLEIIKELKDKASKSALNNQDNMYINVLIREKKFKQYCGIGQQKIRWLIDCAIYKYEISSEQKVVCGPAYGLKMENGSLCDMNNTIASTLTSGANVLVLLKEEYEVEMEEKFKKKGSNINHINLVNNFYDESNDYENEDYDEMENEEEGEEEYDNYKKENEEKQINLQNEQKQDNNYENN